MCEKGGRKPYGARSCGEKFTRNDNTDRKNCCRIDLSSMKEGIK